MFKALLLPIPISYLSWGTHCVTDPHETHPICIMCVATTTTFGDQLLSNSKKGVLWSNWGFVVLTLSLVDLTMLRCGLFACLVAENGFNPIATTERPFLISIVPNSSMLPEEPAGSAPCGILGADFLAPRAYTSLFTALIAGSHLNMATKDVNAVLSYTSYKNLPFLCLLKFSLFSYICYRESDWNVIINSPPPKRIETH